MANASGPGRLIGFIFSLIGKFGPGIVTDIQGLASIFEGHPAAAATPAAVAAASDLASAAKDSNEPLSLASVGEIVDKHDIELNDAQMKDLHKAVNEGK